VASIDSEQRGDWILGFGFWMFLVSRGMRAVRMPGIENGELLRYTWAALLLWCL
jgi:hypothetical protein